MSKIIKDFRRSVTHVHFPTLPSRRNTTADSSIFYVDDLDKDTLNKDFDNLEVEENACKLLSYEQQQKSPRLVKESPQLTMLNQSGPPEKGSVIKRIKLEVPGIKRRTHRKSNSVDLADLEKKNRTALQKGMKKPPREPLRSKDIDEDEIFEKAISMLDLSTVLHQGELQFSRGIKMEKKITQFALTQTHIWIYRSNRYTPYIEISRIVNFVADEDTRTKKSAAEANENEEEFDSNDDNGGSLWGRFGWGATKKEKSTSTTTQSDNNEDMGDFIHDEAKGGRLLPKFWLWSKSDAEEQQMRQYDEEEGKEKKNIGSRIWGWYKGETKEVKEGSAEHQGLVSQVEREDSSSTTGEHVVNFDDQMPINSPPASKRRVRGLIKIPKLASSSGAECDDRSRINSPEALPIRSSTPKQLRRLPFREKLNREPKERQRETSKHKEKDTKEVREKEKEKDKDKEPEREKERSKETKDKEDSAYPGVMMEKRMLSSSVPDAPTYRPSTMVDTLIKEKEKECEKEERDKEKNAGGWWWWSKSAEDQQESRWWWSKKPEDPYKYHFVLEVERDDYRPGHRLFTFSSDDITERDAWVTALHYLLTGGRDGPSLDKFEEEEEVLSPRHTRSQSLMLTAVPGDSKKERVKALKKLEKEDLKSRKKQGLAEAKLSLLELITTKGYPAEEHIVESDGYLLKLHRIPYNKTESAYTPRPVVFLMHGLLDCSVTWIINREAKCLAFILANQGFDVWMGNSRGNKHSRAHTTLEVESDEFWAFNRDNLVQDIKDSIDYVLQLTGQKSLTYIGHSQGTNVCFALLCTDPAYHRKINLFIALAPAVFVANQKSKMMTYVSNMRTDRLFQVLGFRQFMGGGLAFANQYGPSLAMRSAKLSNVFTSLIFKALCGWNPDNNFSIARLPIIAAHQPGGTSVQVMAHWAQAIRTGRFAKYDYGKKKNLEVYQQETPPDYDFDNLRGTNIAIFYGGADKLTCTCDVECLLNSLPMKPVYVHYEPEYAHLDFVWGLDANVKIYPKICELAKEYYEKSLMEADDNGFDGDLKPTEKPRKRRKSKCKRDIESSVAPISKDRHSQHIMKAQKLYTLRRSSSVDTLRIPSEEPPISPVDEIRDSADEIRVRSSGSFVLFRNLGGGAAAMLNRLENSPSEPSDSGHLKN